MHICCIFVYLWCWYFIVWQDLYNIFCLFFVFLPYIYWQDSYNISEFICCTVSLYLRENLRYLLCCFSVFAGKQPAWQVRLGPQQCSWTSPAAAGSDRSGDLENVAMWAMNLMESIDVAVWAIFRLAMCGGCDNVGDVLVVVDGQIG